MKLGTLKLVTQSVTCERINCHCGGGKLVNLAIVAHAHASEFLLKDGFLNEVVKKSSSCSTLSVPNCHTTRRLHEGWDNARMPKPRQGKSRGRGRIRTTDLPISFVLHLTKKAKNRVENSVSFSATEFVVIVSNGESDQTDLELKSEQLSDGHRNQALVKILVVKIEPPTASEVYDRICSLKRGGAPSPQSACLICLQAFVKRNLSQTTGEIATTTSYAKTTHNYSIPGFPGAFDSVNRFALFDTLTHQRMSRKFVNIISFLVFSGFRTQSCVPLSPFPFNFEIGARWTKWLEREFTDRKVRGSNPTSATRLPLSRLGRPGSIPALVQPSCGMAARHRMVATAER
ncbi:hypothetical protein T265_11496 [Opisthorchis viverrini]|uniref:Uncharacterized protein n=1 Tax=Opisthorchis viverrini TaxID=6198 RepID=A0A074Z9A7_OPIVI|nr:hypothetical protein T265_11496 [Opisthorchis viverrini]KER19830.1 hypothetical protein T265_11496 [Opisthorchis viverrini]